MRRDLSRTAQRELIQALSQHYRTATKTEKGQILDQFVKLTRCHRKYAVWLLAQRDLPELILVRAGRRVYDEAVREALTVIWEAADRICGKRLRSVLPDYIDSLAQHGHLKLDAELSRKLLTVSAASIDRILTPVRLRARGGKKGSRKGKPRAKAAVPVRTFADWKEPPPGYFETDFVAHSGGVTSGGCVHSLVLTDIATGWTEGLALVAREQSLVVEALDAVSLILPIPLLGIDTDNDGAFMNETVLEYCKRRGIELTRSRAYLKNDQAWIEQKNGAVVRRFTGYGRLTGILASQVLQRLHQLIRLYVNFFQPSFKLREKSREGSRVRKSYFPPATPCERLLRSDRVSEEAKKRLREEKATLDPLRLLHAIRELQATLAALAAPNASADGSSPGSKDFSTFLSQLPRLWKEGEVRPTHRTYPASPRTWRTRTDPFEAVWPQLLSWLQDEPDLPATELFDKLCSAYPDIYSAGQLRTLQRRVQGWRRAMARELLGLSFNGNETLQ
jgi:hypothetical protein